MYDTVFENVMNALQPTEEIWSSLDSKQYIKLMEALGEECYKRADNCRDIEEKR
jgi:hypothetical protein